jgi:hypothetical protein
MYSYIFIYTHVYMYLHEHIYILVFIYVYNYIYIIHVYFTIGPEYSSEKIQGLRYTEDSTPYSSLFRPPTPEGENFTDLIYQQVGISYIYIYMFLYV